jgi:hypothetical protein
LELKYISNLWLRWAGYIMVKWLNGKGRFCKLFLVLMITFSLTTIINLQFPKTGITKSVSAESTWTQDDLHDFTNGYKNNVKLKGTDDFAELTIDLDDGWFVKSPNPKPSERCFYAMAPIWGTDKILLFGGYDPIQDYILNDTWLYVSTNNSWKKLHPQISPPYRDNHAMAQIWGTDKVLLFGGYYGDELSDTWVFDLSNLSWEEKYPHNNPDERQCHAMAPIHGDDKVVMFGGFWELSHSVRNETYIYDLSDNDWSKLNNTSNNPENYIDHSMASIHGTDKVVLYGGEKWIYNTNLTNGSWYFSNEMWEFDLSDYSWTNITQTYNPGYRIEHAMANIWNTDKVILFGGMNNTTSKGDTWMYNHNNNTWIKLNLENSPGKRYDLCLTTIYGSYRLLLYDGQNDNKYKSDTWIYKYYLDNKNGTFLSTTFDTSTNSSFKAMVWYGYTSYGSSIKFQLRTAATETGLFTKNFTGPGGKLHKYYTDSPSILWSGHDDDRWVQYKVYLNTTDKIHSPALYKVIIYYNNYPLTILKSPYHFEELSDNTPIFKWEINDDSSQSAFQVVIDNNIDFKSCEITSGIIKSSNYEWDFPFGTNYDIIPDGFWYWKVRVQDNEGAWGDFSKPLQFRIDTTPPESMITYPQNNSVHKYIDIISGKASNYDNSTEIVSVEILLERLTDGLYWSSTTWDSALRWLTTSLIDGWTYDPISIDWTASNKYKLSSRAIDRAGNIEIKVDEVIFIIDNEEPWSNITNPDRYWLNNLTDIGGTSADNSSAGIDYVKISIMKSDGSYYWTGRTWDFSVVWLDVDGTTNWTYNIDNIFWENNEEYIITSRAADNSGNKEFPGFIKKFKFDQYPPKNAVIRINNDALYTKSRNVTLDVYAEDTISGLANMSFSLDNKIWCSWEPYAVKTEFELPGVDGEHTIYFRVKDHTDNIGNPCFDTIILDTQPPENLTLLINNGSKETNASKALLTISGYDAMSGVDKMAVSNNGYEWSKWFNYTEHIDHFLLPGNGTRTVWLKLKDKVGNIAEPINATIFLNTSFEPVDTKPPESQNDIDDWLITDSTIIMGAIIFAIIAIILILFGFNMYFKKRDKKEKEETILNKPAIAKRSKTPQQVEDGQLIVAEKKKIDDK